MPYSRLGRDKNTAIETVSISYPDSYSNNDSNTDAQLYDMSGRRANGTGGKGLYIEKNEKGAFKRIVK